MARIRTVKPGLFRHETLFKLETETGLPIRLAWIGLFTVADREGRFKWRPNEIKLDVMPWDDTDFETVLLALESVQLIHRYQVNGEFYGHIPTWHQHQVINTREAKSTIPSPDDALAMHVHAHETHVRAQGEGKGKGREEEKEKERKPVRADASNAASGTPVWNAYREAYLNRYHEEPVRNKLVNSQIKQVIERLGMDDAIEVVGFYVNHNEGFYIKKMHPIGLCLQDCEALRTQWKTGKKITSSDVRAHEKADYHRAQAERLKASV